MHALKDMSLGQRVMLTAAIVIILLILLACVGYMTGNWNEDEAARPGYFNMASAESQPVELEPCMDATTRERLRSIMFDALDSALKSHIEHVFEIWLKDERGQPARAATGVRQGIKAHQSARIATQNWSPPICAN